LAAVLAACAGLAHAQPSAKPGPYNGHKLVRVEVRNAAELMRVNQIVTNVWDCVIGVGPLSVQVTPEQEAALVGLGLEPRVLVADVQRLLDAERAQIDAARVGNDIAWFSTYRTLTEINTRVDQLAATSGGIATTFSIGTSVEGRQIRGIRFSAPDQPGNPRSSRPAVLVHGGQHAREWVNHMTTTFVADQMLEKYLTGDPRMAAILSRVEMIVIPVVNPDGYEFSWTAGNRLWRKNRRPNAGGTIGVDLNRNWGFQWGGEGASTNPGNDTYRGPSAFSEPETSAMRDFVIANPRIAANIDFHSYSQLILSPWGYTSALPLDAALFDDLNDRLADGIQSVNGLRYTAGPAYTTIYPASGVAPDWMWGARGILSWTIELRDNGTNGFVLPADQIIPTARENFEAVLRLAEFVREPVRWSFRSGLPQIAQTGLTVDVKPTIQSGSEIVVPATTKLYQRTSPGAGFSVSNLSALGDSTYQGILAPGSCHQVTQFYFEAQTQLGTVVRYPADAPASVLEVRWGELVQVFSDNMETDRGWSTSAPGDTATSGLWERGIPQATAAQPGNQVTPGGQFCFITGAAAGGSVGAFDVDGGATTLTSPAINGLPSVPYPVIYDATLTYWRFFSNNAGSNPNTDAMLVQLSSNNGATFRELEAITTTTPDWTRREQILPASDISSAMRLRFIASDLGGGSIVEGAVDDVSLRILYCPPDLDINRDENEDLTDAQLLAQVVVGLISREPGWLEGDINGDGNVDITDAQIIAILVSGG
jgi:murein tripeptide amidase MpaA